MAAPAFTRDDLMRLWKSVVDPEYSRPLLENTDSGLELIEQAAEQFATASSAVDRSLQAFYLKPWSGQTGDPASGARTAAVTIIVSRPTDQAIVQPIVFLPGTSFFEEVEPDYGPDVGITVATGRRYTPLATTCMLPGEPDVEIFCQSERPGFGYNVPPPGSITLVDVGASGQAGLGASVMPAVTVNVLSFGRGDVIPPGAVGQYIEFTFGANTGRRARVTGYVPPGGSNPNAAMQLAATGVLQYSFAGPLLVGEVIYQASSGAQGLVRAVANGWIVYEAMLGIFTIGTLVGVTSTAGATVIAIEQTAQLIAETGTAAWRLLSWTDMGVSCTNEDVPVNGASPELDLIGDERNIGRASGEPDDSYRERIYQLPDTVSPNAIKRAANRVLSNYGISACLREVGAINQPFPGFFFDTPDSSGYNAYYYDADPVARPQERYKLYVDHVEMRAFFLLSVPRGGLGEFGFGWDRGGMPFFDAAPTLDFYDGFPVQTAALMLATWQAVDQARAGGVEFDLVPDRYDCAL